MSSDPAFCSWIVDKNNGRNKTISEMRIIPFPLIELVSSIIIEGRNITNNFGVKSLSQDINAANLTNGLFSVNTHITGIPHHLSFGTKYQIVNRGRLRKNHKRLPYSQNNYCHHRHPYAKFISQNFIEKQPYIV